MKPMLANTVVIIGAGPAGLTAAMELNKAGLHSMILEKDRIVGGLSRTVNQNGYGFDIGGHCFLSKAEAVNRFWLEVLGKEFRRNSQQYRIYFNNRFYDYPFRVPNVVRGLGLPLSLSAFLAYVQAHLRPRSPELSVEDHIVNRFGRILYEVFFKTYTEKIWGIPGSGIGSGSAVQPPGNGSNAKAVTDSFSYPRLGPGQMWEKVESLMNAAGNPVIKNAEAISLKHNQNRVLEVTINRGGECAPLKPENVISSMPLRDLVERLDPPAPPDVLEAARALKHRDLITVALVIHHPRLFGGNWVYVQDPSVKVSRIQNYGNWSADLIPEPGHSCLGLEYFCSEGDALWSAKDSSLVDLARREIGYLRLADPLRIVCGSVVRVKMACPVYAPDYGSNLQIIRDYLALFSNLHPIGRNGLHRSSKQGQSMLTAMLAARNVLGEKHNVWSVNEDSEDHEEVRNAN